MSEHPIKELMGVSMEKIKEMVDVNTIIGNPIQSPDGTVIIPVSKVSFGFASGGAGISIQPLAFIVINNGDVKLLQMSIDAKLPNAIVNLVPEVFDKVSGLIGKDKDKKTEE